MPNDFDIAASHYDTVFTNSNIGKAQRKKVFSYINPIISKEKKQSILELNCGTGADAITFGKLGHEVIATDISEGMIEVAKAKNAPQNVQYKVQDINTLTEDSFGKKFDIIFSNFGGLNCVSPTQLQTFLKTASDLLVPNGTLIMVLMPKNCLWERMYFICKGDKTKAMRRNTNKSVIANVDGVGVQTWYYNPEDITALATDNFSVTKIKPVGLTIPPSYLENSIVAKFPILTICKGLDALFTASSLAKYADHFVIILKNNRP